MVLKPTDLYRFKAHFRTFISFRDREEPQVLSLGVIVVVLLSGQAIVIIIDHVLLYLLSDHGSMVSFFNYFEYFFKCS